MTERCGAKFFLSSPATVDNAYQRDLGHDGSHETGLSPVFDLAGVPTRMSISFGQKAPLDFRSVLEFL